MSHRKLKEAVINSLREMVDEGKEEIPQESILYSYFPKLSKTIENPEPLFEEISTKPEIENDPYTYFVILLFRLLKTEDSTEKLNIVEEIKELFNKHPILLKCKCFYPLYLEYLIFRGDLFWDLSIYHTAIRSYEEFLGLFETKPFSDLIDTYFSIIIKLSSQNLEEKEYQKSFFYLIRAIKTARSLNSALWEKMFIELSESMAVKVLKYYSYASLVLLWEGNNQLAYDLIIKAVLNLAEILEFVPKIIRNKETTTIIELFLSVLRKKRNLSESDIELIEILSSITGYTDKQLITVAKTLKKVIGVLHKPNIHLFLLISSISGAPIFTKILDPLLLEQISKEKGSTINEEYLSQSAGFLYAGLINALDSIMDVNIKSSTDYKSIRYENMILTIVKGEKTIGVVFTDRESQTVIHNLIRLVNLWEEKFSEFDGIAFKREYTLYAQELYQSLFSEFTTEE